MEIWKFFKVLVKCVEKKDIFDGILDLSTKWLICKDSESELKKKKTGGVLLIFQLPIIQNYLLFWAERILIRRFVNKGQKEQLNN